MVRLRVVMFGGAENIRCLPAVTRKGIERTRKMIESVVNIMAPSAWLISRMPTRVYESFIYCKRGQGRYVCVYS